MTTVKSSGSTGRELRELGKKLQSSKSTREKFKVAGKAAKVSIEIAKRSTSR